MKTSIAPEPEAVSRYELGPPSFEGACDRWYHVVHRFIAVRVQHPQTAEDLTSDTFLKAQRGWPPRNAAQPEGVMAWLFKIAQRCIVDHYRAAGRRPVVSLDDEFAGRAGGAALV